MPQVTWRAPESLIQQVHTVSEGQGLSMNEWLTRLATTAVADDEQDPPGARLRARLRAAGLLAPAGRLAPGQPPADSLAAARQRAGQGKQQAADIVAETRGERG
ncbi:MAG: hypothetical protein LBK72_00995 [Bifidobacteriaceae bacterium]|jgi:hypothetical protein|nr:hypothetical protein [Bifidobacteriaceae bacterium]